MQRPRAYLPEKIVSGGQTGVDRGALDAAIALGIEHGGWCPRGRLAEDGVVPSRYHLRELDSADYAERTARNVQDSDATLILYEGRMSGGTLLTMNVAKRYGRVYLVKKLTSQQHEFAKLIDDVVDWLRQHQPRSLNIAGPRESNRPGIEQRSAACILAVLNRLYEPR
jgi:hypothetical protein